MEDWVLAGLPLTVRVWNWWGLWKNASQRPVHEVWVVCQCLCMHGMVVQNNWTVTQHTTTNTPDNEVHAVEVGNPAACVEILDWKLTDKP